MGAAVFSAVAEFDGGDAEGHGDVGVGGGSDAGGLEAVVIEGGEGFDDDGAVEGVLPAGRTKSGLSRLVG